MLSDPTRKREYDSLHASKKYNERTTDSKSSSTFFSQFFGNGAQGAQAGANQQPDAEGVFTDVFEEVGVGNEWFSFSIILIDHCA